MNVSDLVTVLVIGLAAYRVTRLVVLDTILGEYPDPEAGRMRGTGLRKAVDLVAYDDTGEDRNWLAGKFGQMMTCYFCAGVWVTAATWCAWEFGPHWLQVVVMAAAACGVQAFVSSRPES